MKEIFHEIVAIFVNYHYYFQHEPARVPNTYLSTQDLHFPLSFASVSTVSRDNSVSSIIRSLYCFDDDLLDLLLVK